MSNRTGITKIPGVSIKLTIVLLTIWILLWTWVLGGDNSHLSVFSKVGGVFGYVLLVFMVYNLIIETIRGGYDLYAIKDELRQTLPDRHLVWMSEVEYIYIERVEKTGSPFLKPYDKMVLALKNGSRREILIGLQIVEQKEVVRRLEESFSLNGYNLKIVNR